jgi:hypothetical protein
MGEKPCSPGMCADPGWQGMLVDVAHFVSGDIEIVSRVECLGGTLSDCGVGKHHRHTCA